MIQKHQKMNEENIEKHCFEDVTLLITHYNRSASLENLLTAFKKRKIGFGDIVVSDDGSKTEHLSKVETLSTQYGFRLIKALTNSGLGNNINKGQDAVHTKYTLYVQEDFEPTILFTERFISARQFMEEDAALDIVKFYAYYPYPYLRDFKSGFSKMVCPKFGKDYTKIYAYTDHPHLRRSTFLNKFGRYPEGLKGDFTEYKMCISFLQNKGKGLFANDFDKIFLQKNSASEPSTMTRGSWKASKNTLISFARDCYRNIKYNYDITFMKPLKKTTKKN